MAYTPDSFGHPAQLPTVFAGFGLDPFVYWRGNGNELDRLGPVYRWLAPSGDGVTAYHLGRGYFAAACLPADPAEAAEGLAGVLDRLADVSRAPVVLMNGIDHMLPDAHTAAVAEALAERTGRSVTRGLLDDLQGEIDESDRGSFTGELVGGKVANLLPGVWSARLGLKLANRAAERALSAWAEPWAALGVALGVPDERPSVRAAWRALLPNQAHDSICGCSQDEVHRQMQGRYATATELADQTAGRVLERLAGLGAERRVPWSTELDVAVFNPSPATRTDVVRVALDGYPVYQVSDMGGDIHPLTLVDGTNAGYEADGTPVRAIPAEDPRRMRLFEGMPGVDLEFVVADVPAFGWRRVHLAPSVAHPETVDDGRRVSVGDLEVEAADDGTLTVARGGSGFAGLGALEDVGDRGDTYDADPVGEEVGGRPATVTVTRHRHPSGIQRLVVQRVLAVPARDEVAFRAVPAGDDPILEPGVPLVAVAPASVVLSALKPAEDGDGFVVRLSNPAGSPVDTTVTFGLPVGSVESVRLDEQPDGGAVALDGGVVHITVGPHGLRSIRLRVAGAEG